MTRELAVGGHAMYLKTNEFVTLLFRSALCAIFVFAGTVNAHAQAEDPLPSWTKGSNSIKAKYEIRNGIPVIVKQPEIDFINDKAGKPLGINRHIGRRPVLAVGNSDGDFEMLEWTTGGDGPRLAMIVHHDDDRREWAYDRESHIGRLVRGLDEGPQRGWKIISMKNDWSRIYP